MNNLQSTTIFTDGSSRGNPGPGGWGAVLIVGASVIELGGRVDHTTNNRMELSAAINALRKTSKEAEIKLYTDSSYVINGITKWVKGWKRNGWVTKTKDDVLNKDLWTELDTLAIERTIKWEYVGGHAGIAGNERCDEIATSFADNLNPELYKGTLDKYSIRNILNVGAVKSQVETKSRKNAPAYSYVSAVNGIVEVVHTWTECEKRVKGIRGAKFKKALNIADEAKIIEEFRVL